MDWYTKLDEYRKIGQNIFIPSFLILLLSSSAIILTYAIIQESTPEIITGIILYLFSFFIIIPIIRCSDYREENLESDSHVVKGLINKKQGYSYIKKIILPSMLISLFIPIRIISIMKSYPVNDESTVFYGQVESVKLLRYTREAVIIFSDGSGNGSSHSKEYNRAVSYIPERFPIDRGDIIEIHTRPKEIDINKSNNSSFLKKQLRRGFSFIFYLNENNFTIVKEVPISFKESIRRGIDENVSTLFNGKTASIIKALYFGNKKYIDKATILDFKRAGVLHILAASGLHVGILSTIPIFILGTLRINRKIILLATVAVVYFYLYITDIPVSLLRAFIMLSLYSVQYIFDLERNILNTLFLTAIIILMIYPNDLYSLGFQLSFGATLGIILFLNFYSNALSTLPSPIAKSLSLTLSAQILVIPVIFLHLREINLIGVISNIMIVPGMALTLIFSLIANVVFPISNHIGMFFALITEFIFSLNLQIVELFSGIDGHFIVEEISYILVISTILLFLPVLLCNKNQKVLAISILLALVSAWFYLSDNRVFNENQIAVLNHDNTDVIILTRGRETIVFGKIGNIVHARTIARYMDVNGIKNITLCIPVADYRNIKNYTHIVKNSIVSRCYLSSNFSFSPVLKRLCEILDADRVELKIREFRGSSENIDMALRKPFANISYIHNYILNNPKPDIAVIHNKYSIIDL
ncbi:MAG: ComEC/Rec2 family competence protein [Spirochaetota bacterium]|nr:ComEC/Rec2 family competence protein [Spirochaetota bacterium]